MEPPEVQKYVLEEMSLMQRLQELSGACQVTRQEGHVREEQHKEDSEAVRPVVLPALHTYRRRGVGQVGIDHQESLGPL